MIKSNVMEHEKKISTLQLENERLNSEIKMTKVEFIN